MITHENSPAVHHEIAKRLQLEAEMHATWAEILSRDPSLAGKELSTAVDLLVERVHIRMDEIRTQHEREANAWCERWDQAAKVMGVSSDELMSLCERQRFEGAQPEFVLWGGKTMKRGKCDAPSKCVACERIGSHLEPVGG